MPKRYRFLGEKGKLVTWSKVYNPPLSFRDQVSYVVGLVEVRGERTMGQLVGVGEEELEAGMEVVGVLRRLYADGEEGVIVYGTKFKPVDKGSNDA